MPHLKLEYSNNLKEQIDPKKLFSLCHNILVETINASLSHCQSQAKPCDLFYVAEGSSQNAFIYLEILILEGRPSIKLHETQKQISKILEDYFSRSRQELKLQIAIRIVEMPKSHYLTINP